MPEIKICGITNKDDAHAAVDYGVDALGFIFHPLSPRYVTPEAAATIISSLPSHPVTVGVFVNYDAGEVKKIQKFCNLDLIQLHGDETPDYCRLFPSWSVIKALSPQTGSDLKALEQFTVRVFLLDAREGERYGGTGLTTDWDLAARIGKIYPLVLAGGLKAENICQALDQVAPRAVDINSGVESSPGRKDHRKLRHVVEIIRRRETGGKEKKIFGREQAHEKNSTR